jgi:hypothetical protein
VSLFAAGYGHAPISLSGNLVGRYGGYTAGNGHGNAAYINQGGAVEVISSDRVASRWNPFGVKGTSLPDSTQILGTRSADSFRAGLVQRMAYSDSMRRIVCPQCEVPPYLNFPANVVLPINWRKSRPAWAGNAAALEYKTGSVDSTICPIDSLLWALDWVLNKGQTYGTGTLYLRTVLDDPKSLWIANDRDSFPASHPYLYPREPWTTRIGGRLIQTYAINSFLVGASADSVKFVNARDVCRLLGFFTPVIHAEYGNTFVGESYGQDVNGNTLGGTIKSGALRNLGPRYADRVAYQHGFSGGYPINGRGNYDVEGFIVALAQQIRALSTLAGRAATRCVAPWQVYGHD